MILTQIQKDTSRHESLLFAFKVLKGFIHPGHAFVFTLEIPAGINGAEIISKVVIKLAARTRLDQGEGLGQEPNGLLPQRLTVIKIGDAVQEIGPLPGILYLLKRIQGFLKMPFRLLRLILGLVPGPKKEPAAGQGLAIAELFRMTHRNLGEVAAEPVFLSKGGGFRGNQSQYHEGLRILIRRYESAIFFNRLESGEGIVEQKFLQVGVLSPGILLRG